MPEIPLSNLTSAISTLVETQYGIPNTLVRLAGENENYLVTTPDNERFVLKLADEETTDGMMEIEHLAVERLMDSGLDLCLPRVKPTRSGGILARMMTDKGLLLRGRLLEFVQGKAWGSCLPAGPARLEDLGRTIARMNTAMEVIVHPDARRTHLWDLARADQHRSGISLINDPFRRKIIERIFHFYAAIARPEFSNLPRSLIHGDINDDNVLVAEDRVTGMLDFGDCLENPVICDLAIALAYHTLDEEDPLEAGAAMVGAYHQVRPLSREEVTLLFPLMCTRLAVSVIISAQRRLIDPHRESWFVSEERAWKKLAFFDRIPPAEAAIHLASKTGLTLYEDRGQPAAALMEQRARFIGPSLSLLSDPLETHPGKGPVSV